MPKLLILSRHAGEYQRLIAAAGLPGLDLVAASKPEEAIRSGKSCDIVFGEPPLIREVLASLPNVLWVQATYAGVEPLLDPSLRRDYLLTNARGVFGGLMSEYVFGYMLMHERRIFERYQAQQEHRWDGSMTGTLRGKTLGLLGVGSIGAHLAQTAKHFEMKVRGYTRSSEALPDVDVYFHGADLLIFANSLDYLVAVLPNTKETHRIVNASLLSSLPPHTLLINAGRGSAVDEIALIYALETRQIAGAVLDVFEEEPLPRDHPFWDAPNLLMTFHTSAPSLPKDISKLFVENYKKFTRGERLNYEVDFERGY